MSKNTKIAFEATKIITKWIAFLAAVYASVFALTHLYIWYGVRPLEAELYGGLTIVIPMVVFSIAVIVWSEAKHRVWKRENNIE